MNTGKKVLLSMQHTIAMFGATVLVPYLTGLNPSTALLTAGLGTLLFHLVTGGTVPIFLGSSFAFIGVIQIVSKEFGMQYALGGIVAAGLVYVAVAIVVRFLGHGFFQALFPPVVTGSVIMVIGLTLSPVAIDMASNNWVIALVVFFIAAMSSLAFRGFLQMLPILIAVTGGYLISIAAGIVDFTAVSEAAWIGLPSSLSPLFAGRRLPSSHPWPSSPSLSTGVTSMPTERSWAATLSKAPAYGERSSETAHHRSPVCLADPPIPPTAKTPPPSA